MCARVYTLFVDKMETLGGGNYLTDTKLLNEEIQKSGLKKKWLAKQLGLSPYGFTLKINNMSQFKAEEMIILSSLLSIEEPRLRERIFFAS